MSIGGMEQSIHHHSHNHHRRHHLNHTNSPDRNHEHPENHDSQHVVHFDGNQSSINSRSRNRSATSSQWSRTSFKIGKPKPSKIRYLTRHEIIGISLSMVLSFIFAMILTALFYFGAPFVMDNLMQFADTMQGNSNSNNDTMIETEKPVKASSRISNDFLPEKMRNRLTLLEYLNEEEFITKSQRHLSNSAPLLFTLFTEQESFALTSSEIVSEFTDQIKDYLIHVLPIDSFYITHNHFPDLSLSWKEYLSFEFSLSQENEHFHFFACDAQSIQHLPLSFRQTLTNKLFTALPSLKASFSPNITACVGHREQQFSGTSFLIEKERIYYLAEGEVHWVLFPSSVDKLPTVGFNPLKNLQDWKTATTDVNLIAKDPSLVHVIQKSGEFLYIPEGWYHASHTISNTSLSFVYEMKFSQSNNFYHYLEEGNHRMQNQDYKGALRMYKMGLGMSRNLLLLEKLADVNVLLQNYLAAEELYRELIDLNPVNPIPYGKLIELLINNANRDISDSIAALLNFAEEKGIKNDVLRIANDHL